MNLTRQQIEKCITDCESSRGKYAIKWYQWDQLRNEAVNGDLVDKLVLAIRFGFDLDDDAMRWKPQLLFQKDECWLDNNENILFLTSDEIEEVYKKAKHNLDIRDVSREIYVISAFSAIRYTMDVIKAWIDFYTQRIEEFDKELRNYNNTVPIS